MKGHPLKVFVLLKDRPGELDALEAFARVPGRTTEDCREYLVSRGHSISRNATWRWMRQYQPRLGAISKQERLLVAAIKEAERIARNGGDGMSVLDTMKRALGLAT